MAEVKSSWFEPSHDGSATDNVSIADARIRLFNLWVTMADVTDAEVTLRTVSASGTVISTVNYHNPNWGVIDPNLIIPGGGLLFEDGLYVVTGNDAGNHKIMTVTVVYQSG